MSNLTWRGLAALPTATTNINSHNNTNSTSHGVQVQPLYALTPFDAHYSLGAALGNGRQAHVYSCAHLSPSASPKAQLAVKVIQIESPCKVALAADPSPTSSGFPADSMLPLLEASTLGNGDITATGTSGAGPIGSVGTIGAAAAAGTGLNGVRAGTNTNHSTNHTNPSTSSTGTNGVHGTSATTTAGLNGHAGVNETIGTGSNATNGTIATTTTGTQTGFARAATPASMSTLTSRASSMTNLAVKPGAFGVLATPGILTSPERLMKWIGDEYVAREIAVLTLCRGHPFILQLVDVLLDCSDADYQTQSGGCTVTLDRCYLVTEQLAGGALLDRIRDSTSNSTQQPLLEQDASIVAQNIASALAFLHARHIAHRDLKPANILCATTTRITPVKLADFGLVSALHSPRPSRSATAAATPMLQTPVGTMEYVAPEIAHSLSNPWDKSGYGKACDLWSFGVLLYVLLCGTAPFTRHCGRKCGFSEGRSCEYCQDLIADAVEAAEFDFEQKEWKTISSSAKDLVTELLVHDPSSRLSAENVLCHPWVAQRGSRLPLQSPAVLRGSKALLQPYLDVVTTAQQQRDLQCEISDVEAVADEMAESLPPFSGDDSPISMRSANDASIASSPMLLGMDEQDEFLQDNGLLGPHSVARSLTFNALSLKSPLYRRRQRQEDNASVAYA
ncbi:Mnk1 protein [Capsaspora owczarzaki ATCC 30864]|uniref:CAMK/MAPKAPK/MNK protein kinase n=1 Tax=Capsaspora owczarzaki (strain ATCC 30864) TaxID=595528 RepID=A0A0D2UJM7_CAPO3|nr:Mnk1 protein [Capsaspora owczarzaki ATCC 30864]KJE95311.1 CAMK/MAPKAPK/MNK protein kinase [Capsaspora owczarzaki ATCC 30864]|eukprot:XP_004346446.2 Mnk1 protein [Capsaspora owczarzaki ATCC 30864]